MNTDTKLRIIGNIFVTAFMYFIIWLIKEPFRLFSSITWLEFIAWFLLLFIVNYIIDENSFSNITIIFGGICALLFLIWMVVRFGSADAFHANNRYLYVKNNVTVIEDNGVDSPFPNLLGENNDTSNLPLIGIPEAIKRAETEMGRRPALGSQFEIVKDEITSQNINNSLMYVVPLEPKNWYKWDASGNRGYFIIDRNNGNTTYIEDSLYTTEKAPFNDNAKRILNTFMRQRGINGRITELSPEVDDEGNFFYVATVYQSSGIEGLDTVIGIIELNPYYKTCEYYPLGKIPEYVDRVFPEWIFEQYVKYYGEYVNGWWNSFIGQRNVQEATDDFDVIYIDGVCYYYTGFTSAGKGESSNGIIMMNCRTGEITYHVTYGISELRAIGVAEGKVQEKEYKASYPLLLMINGEETYFMLMRDKNQNLVGYAFVNYKDYTKSAVNESLINAQTDYVKACAMNNEADSLNHDSLSEIKGTIVNLSSEVVDSTTMYYVKLSSSDKIFMFRSNIYLDILFTNEGDELTIKYIDSNSRLITAIEVE